MRRLLPGLIVVAQALLCVIAAPASAVPVDVATRTALTVDVAHVGRALDLEARLVDDVAQGLGFRPVEITMTPLGGDAVVVVTESDRLGEFAWSGILDEGPWTVAVRFDGDPWHEPAEAHETVELVRRPVRLEAALAGTVPVGTREVSMRVEAVAASYRLDARDAVSVVACGGDEVEMPLGGGSATIAVPLPAQAGECAIRATVSASDRHLGGELERTVRVVDGATVSVDAVEAERGPFEPPTFAFSGRVVDVAGPVAGARVVVTMDRVGDVEARTDGSGAWSATAVGRGLPPGEWAVEARFVLDAGEGDPVAARASTSVTRTRSAIDEAPILVGLGLGALVFVALIGWGIERVGWGPLRRRDRSSAPVGVAGARVEPLTTATPVADKVRIAVLDAHHGRPVDARVALRDAAGDHTLELERTPTTVSPSGARRWLVSARAPGYLPLDVAVDVPRPGHRLVVRMVSVRSRVRDTFRDVAQGLDVDAAQGAWWGRASTSEIAVAVRGTLRTLRREGAADAIVRRRLAGLLDQLESGDVGAVEAWDALTLLVDDVYFSGRVYSPAVIDIAERLAAVVASRGQSPATAPGGA